VVVLDVAGHAGVSLLYWLRVCDSGSGGFAVQLQAMLPSQYSDLNGSFCAGYLLLCASCTVAQLILPVFNI
jgi:hypothetical protein